MADVTVTDTTVSALDANQALTANAATSTVLGGTQKFIITPNKAASKMLLMFQDTSTAAIAPYTYSVAAGDHWAAKEVTGSAGSTAAADNWRVLQLESAKIMQSTGTIEVTFAPGSTLLALQTHHHLNVYALELL
jgi:hypothetical protein